MSINTEDNILKYCDDFYYNLNSYTDEFLDTIKEFSLRPNNPIRKIGIPFFKTDTDNVNRILEKEYDIMPIKLHTDQFNLTNKILMKQYFYNVALNIPSINSPKIDNGLVKIYNSKNLDMVYKKILENIGNKENLYFVYTKRFYKSSSNNYIKYFDEYLMEKKNCYYIIPQINIYINYNKIENKLICELSGTIIN